MQLYFLKKWATAKQLFVARQRPSYNELKIGTATRLQEETVGNVKKFTFQHVVLFVMSDGSLPSLQSIDSRSSGYNRFVMFETPYPMVVSILRSSFVPVNSTVSIHRLLRYYCMYCIHSKIFEMTMLDLYRYVIPVQVLNPCLYWNYKYNKETATI